MSFSPSSQTMPNPTATVLFILSSANTLGDLEGMQGALLRAETFAACYYPVSSIFFLSPFFYFALFLSSPSALPPSLSLRSLSLPKFYRS